MEFKDYYQTLGLERSATQEEIKKAFRKLARKFHPDVSKEPNAEARMKEVNEAYSVLCDTEKRAAYDQIGAGYQAGQEFNAPPGWDAGFEFSGSDQFDSSDFFNNLFGKIHQEKHRTHSAHGEDQHAKIVIDIADAFTTSTRQIVLQEPRLDAQGRVAMVQRKLDVTIPAGVKEGQYIRLAGMGKPGFDNKNPGDLYLEVQFAAHPKYRAEGRDIYAKTPITPWEAALGGAIAVTTPSGAVQVTVPPGSQSGRKLRLRGRGIPGGDMYLVLDVVVPPAVTEREREIYQTMAREMAFNPRQ